MYRWRAHHEHALPITIHFDSIWTIWELRNKCVFFNESDLCVI
jgi:hypothetical protein